MAEQQNISISRWPSAPVKVSHAFSGDACPVSIHFEPRPARVRIETSRTTPLNVSMEARLAGKAPIPICIRVCEPICADSDYRVGLTAFDEAVAEVAVRGRTKIGACKQGKATVCVNFSALPSDARLTEPFSVGSLTFQPLGVRFPSPSDGVVLRLHNYASPSLTLTVHVDSGVSSTHEIPISNELKTIPLAERRVVGVDVKGGQYEASLVEICFEPSRASGGAAAPAPQ
jgi:hypothetical protein